MIYASRASAGRLTVANLASDFLAGPEFARNAVEVSSVTAPKALLTDTRFILEPC